MYEENTEALTEDLSSEEIASPDVNPQPSTIA